MIYQDNSKYKNDSNDYKDSVNNDRYMDNISIVYEEESTIKCNTICQCYHQLLYLLYWVKHRQLQRYSQIMERKIHTTIRQILAS